MGELDFYAKGHPGISQPASGRAADKSNLCGQNRWATFLVEVDEGMTIAAHTASYTTDAGNPQRFTLFLFSAKPTGAKAGVDASVKASEARSAASMVAASHSASVPAHPSCAKQETSSRGACGEDALKHPSGHPVVMALTCQLVCLLVGRSCLRDLQA